jgi:RNA polymerase sigma-70 factor, ECF subfamily
MTAVEAAACEVATRGISGEAEAPADFESIYREHFRFVWRVARRLGIEAAFLDDVVQETFVVVHRRLGDFGRRSTVKTWLYGIVRRVVADHLRVLRRKPPGKSIETAAEMASTADTTVRSPEASMERAEQVHLLRKLLEGLDDDKREVFILAEIEEMTMAEVAEALGANVNTVASRLRSARREFEDALKRALGNEGWAADRSSERSTR